MTSNDLSGSRAKINGAKAQIKLLEAEMIAFLRSKPYRIFDYVDLKTNEMIVKLLATKPIPDSVHATTGMILNALRSSLDVLAVSLAERNSATVTNDVYFPISASQAVFLDDGLKKIKRLSQADIAVIKNLKPYKGGDDLLYALHTLNLVDVAGTLLA